VDVPCSGFKLLLSLLTLSAGFSYLTDMRPGRKWALFLLSLPLSVVINTVRIAIIGVIGACIGASTAERLHDASGLFALVLCMAVLFGIARGLGCRRFAGLPLF
jgi:exosortase/archaeosortase family protein